MRRVLAGWLVIVLVGAGVAGAPVRVARAAGAIGALGEAQSYFNAGDYYKAEELAAPLTEDESIPRADRAEAFRITGLALYFLGKREEAEARLLEFLKLEPDARLDPALVPPDGIAFFENVRAEYANELLAYRPRRKWRDNGFVGFLPVVGQWQNGEKAKSVALLTGGLLLLSTHVTSYYLLEDMCSARDDTCEDESQAAALKTINWVSGGLFIAVVIYGAVDSQVGYRRRKAEFDAANAGIGVQTGAGRVSLTWSGRF